MACKCFLLFCSLPFHLFLVSFAVQPTEWVKMKGQLANVLRKEKGKEEDLENTEEKLDTTEDRNRSLRK